MRFRLLYFWKTTAGTFYIGQSDDGRFHPIYNDESYGSYANAWQATEELARNCLPIFYNGSRIDTSELGIPDHSREWERINSAN